MALSYPEQRQAIVDGSNLIMDIGAISMSNHGNFSVKVPDQDAILITAVASLKNVKPDQLAIISFDGKVLEGEVSPTSMEIINMHLIIYKKRPGTGAVVHTHAPFITAFACAQKDLDCSYEAMVRAGMTEAIPVAGYGPRGSDESVKNIEKVMNGDTPLGAVMLGNHGLLAWGADAASAARANNVVEESAQIATYAAALGGAIAIPAAMRSVTIARRDEFAAAGNVRA